MDEKMAEMERPPSQLENVRPTGLRPPSRLPAMASSDGRTLLETSQSDLNARTAVGGNGGLMPPPTGPVKHKMSGLPEPPTKRKTLAERAGEPLQPLRSHVPPLSKPTFSRSDSTTAQVGIRAPSATGTRSISNTSIVGSNGSGRGSRRPASHLIATRPPSVAETRTTVEDESETEAGVMGKRKGTPILSFNSTNGIGLRKTRGQPSSADMSTRSQHSGTHIRNISSSSTSSDGYGGDGRTVLATQRKCTRTRTTSTTSRTSSTSQIQKDAVHGRATSRSVSDSLSNAFADLSLTPKHPPHKTSGPKSSTTKHRPSLERIKEEVSPSKIPKFSCTPSLRHAQSSHAFLSTPSFITQKNASVSGLRTPVTSARRTATKDEFPVFLTKEKLTPMAAWDTKGRLEDMESLYAQLRTQFACAADSKTALEESLALYKSRVQELMQLNKDLSTTNKNLTSDLERARNDLHATTTDLRQARRDHEHDVQDAERKHEKELNEMLVRQERDSQRFERELEKIAAEAERDMDDLKRTWDRQKDEETAEMTTQHWEELEEIRTQHKSEVEKLQSQLDDLRRSGEGRATESATEVQALKDSAVGLEDQLESAKTTTATLRSQVMAAEARNASLEQEKTTLISKTHFLEGNQEAQSLEFTTMREKLQDAIDARNASIDRLRKEEMLRRKLNATILELRGNIRVFVRTRPLLPDEEGPARVEYPDVESLDGGKEMVVHAPTTLSATGKERNEKHSYAFDRVFAPTTANSQVFDDCRDLIQSVIDGYNVSILSYGQTGSGKTFGMSGPDGIIPSSIALLLSEIERLREKGWEYVVEASFVEVYNEMLNDLLGDAKTWDDASADDGNLGASVRGKGKKEKHEIHHDSATGKTTVTNLSSVTLWPPPENEGQWPPPAPTTSTSDSVEGRASSYTEQAVTHLLDTAAKNRRVAATKANERSSRSHSIFILTLRGHCKATNERSEGVLNLVDLAGSERLKQSGAEGNRMKETQAINKSLSSLGDVIAALGAKGGKGEETHVPYRNSKLTYLLQSSLGGTTAAGKSSRTLMLLHLCPLRAHWQESRSSLLFGSKVLGAHIGAARKK